MLIFISYASEDRETAERIHFALTGAGHHTFFDSESLPPGHEYHERIKAAVQHSDALVFLASPDSTARGSYALTELKYARAKWHHPAGHVIPVRIRNVLWESIPSYLKAVTVLETEGNVEAEIVFAVSKLRRTGGAVSKATTKVVVPILVAIIVVIGVLGAAVLQYRSNKILSPSERGGLVSSADPSYVPAKEARVFIHIVREAQRDKAQYVKAELERQGFVVMRIILHNDRQEPGAHVIYWNNNDKNEAETIGRTLEQLGITTKAQVVDRSFNTKETPISRSYELWLPESS